MDLKNIKILISDGKIDDAIAQILLLPITDVHLENLIISLSARRAESKRKSGSGVVSSSEEALFFNQCIASILSFLDEFSPMIDNESMKLNADYQEGRKKLLRNNYTEANDFFEKVLPIDACYLKTLHDQSIIKYATATTKNDIEGLFTHMNNLEILIIRDKIIDRDLLEKFLFNRGVIFESLGFIDLAKQDFEKIKILGSELGSEHL